MRQPPTIWALHRGMPSRSCRVMRLHYRFAGWRVRVNVGQEFANGMQEGLGRLGEAEVPGVGQFDELRAGDGVGKRASGDGPADSVGAADDDERGGGDPGELRAHVVVRRESLEEVGRDVGGQRSEGHQLGG